MKESSGSQQFPPRLLEKEAKRILDRAMELDHVNGPHMSMDNLRTIARDLGISDEALDTAMRESLQAASGNLPTPVPPARADDSTPARGWLSRWWGGRRERWSKDLQWLTKFSLPVGLGFGIFFSKAVQDSRLDLDGAILVLVLATLSWAGTLVLRPRRSTAAQIISLSFLFWFGLALGGNLTAWLVFGSSRTSEIVTAVSSTYFAISVSAGVFVTALIALVRQFLPRGASASSGGGAPNGDVMESRSQALTRSDTHNQFSVVAE